MKVAVYDSVRETTSDLMCCDIESSEKRDGPFPMMTDKITITPSKWTASVGRMTINKGLGVDERLKISRQYSRGWWCYSWVILENL